MPSGSRRTNEVCDGLYSPAAGALMVRAAPAKKRSSSEQIGSSSAASDCGLPTLADSSAASSSAWRSTASASARSASIRAPGVVSRQPMRAARAARHRALDVGGRALGDGRDHLAGGRVEDLARGAFDGVDELTGDEVAVRALHRALILSRERSVS